MGFLTDAITFALLLSKRIVESAAAVQVNGGYPAGSIVANVHQSGQTLPVHIRMASVGLSERLIF